MRKRLSFVLTGILATAGLTVLANPALATSCVTSAQYGVCFPANGLQNFQVNNNVWNASHASSWSQTLTAAEPSQWYIDAKIVNTSGQVISYPESSLQYLQSQQPLSYWTTIDGSWHAGLPPTTTAASTDKYEAAFDLWLDAGPGQSGSKEVMIWTENHNQSPGGTDKGTWTDPTYGNKYEVWENSTTVWFVCKVGSHTGSVDIKAALTKAVNDVWPGDPGYNYQFDYGFEIVSAQSTTGTTEHFNLAGVSISQG